MEKPVFLKTKEEIPSDVKFIDAFEKSLEELFIIRNPHMKKGFGVVPKGFNEAHETFFKKDVSVLKSVLVYYPWLKKTFHIPDEPVYFELRTARNKYIINKEEQNAYRNMFVGVAGMSVGSNIALMFARTGGAQRMRLADFDIIEISNLNRIPASLSAYGEPKVLCFARHIYEIDPWAKLELYNNGINIENLEDFIGGLDVFVDEMDSLDLKVRARFVAKKLRVPVLMATDNGNDVILDIERYDIDPSLPIFNGRISLKEEDLKQLQTPQDWMRIASQIADPTTHSPKMLDSIVGVISKTLAGVPQLGSTASIAGAAVSLATRHIAVKLPMPSGRYLISLDEKLIPDFFGAPETIKREKSLKNFLEKMQH